MSKAFTDDPVLKDKPTLVNFDHKFEDVNGRLHIRYVVRRIGNQWSPFDRYTNAFIIANADQIPMNKDLAYHYLWTHGLRKRPNPDYEGPDVQAWQRLRIL